METGWALTSSTRTLVFLERLLDFPFFVKLVGSFPDSFGNLNHSFWLCEIMVLVVGVIFVRIALCCGFFCKGGVIRG